MKINDTPKKPAAGVGAAGTAPTRTNTASGSAGVAKTASANVTLSAQAESIKSAGGVFDAGKVEEIKAAIASGQFQVDAHKVAEGLMDTVKDLISTRKG